MNRVDQGHDFAAQVERGDIGPDAFLRLADMVAAWHAQAEPVHDLRAAVSIPETIAETTARLDDLTETSGLHAALTLWHGEVLALVHRLAGRMEERRKDGVIRRGHGALHLGHIGMVDGSAVPFDAIDFDDRLATGDVLYDIAFLLMDLVARDRKDIANRVLNRYLAVTEDYDGLDLMALFMSLRAATRAAACLQGEGPMCRAGATYLTLAVDLLNAAPSPMLVAVGGASDGGRSALSAALAPRIPGPFGAVILSAAGFAPAADRIDPAPARMLHLAGVALDAGQVAILDAPFPDPATRSGATALAASRGIVFRGLWLESGPRTPPGPAGWKQIEATETLPVMTANSLRALTTCSAARWPSPSGT